MMMMVGRDVVEVHSLVARSRVHALSRYCESTMKYSRVLEQVLVLTLTLTLIGTLADHVERNGDAGEAVSEVVADQYLVADHHALNHAQAADPVIDAESVANAANQADGDAEQVIELVGDASEVPDENLGADQATEQPTSTPDSQPEESQPEESQPEESQPEPEPEPEPEPPMQPTELDPRYDNDDETDLPPEPFPLFQGVISLDSDSFCSFVGGMKLALPMSLDNLSGRRVPRTFTKPVWLIEFYTQWCKHCKAFAEPFQVISAHLGTEEIAIGSVDVGADEQLRKRFGIEYLPTLMVIEGGCDDGTMYLYPHSHNRTVKAVLRFARGGYKTLPSAPVPPPYVKGQADETTHEQQQNLHQQQEGYVREPTRFRLFVEESLAVWYGLKFEHQALAIGITVCVFGLGVFLGYAIGFILYAPPEDPSSKRHRARSTDEHRPNAEESTVAKSTDAAAAAVSPAKGTSTNNSNNTTTAAKKNTNNNNKGKRK